MKAARGARCIVVFDTVSVGVPSAVVARIMTIPLIVRLPGDYAWEQSVQRFGVTDSIDAFQHKRYGFRVEALRSLQRFVVRSAALSVAPSDYFKSIASGWGVKPERLTRIYLGLDFNESSEVPHNVPEGKILFSLGRLVPWKGFSLLIDLLSELTHWHLIIAGDGPLRTALYEQACALGVEKRITFTGALPHAQVLGWYRRADAFALNTSFESFSFQIVEAMKAGVPVITTTVGNIPELIDNGVEGVLCAPDDEESFRNAIVSTETEQALWEKRTMMAAKKAEQFTLSASLEAFEKVLKTICA
jgi:glycosyltransferase involved in cell wall biosynthesis